MKTKLPVGVCVLLMLALVAFGLLYGTYAGFGEDRAAVDGLLQSENGLLTVLGYRGADGCNLSVVARRHLEASDPDVQLLESSARVLQESEASLADKRSANDALEAAVAAVSAKLHNAPSFQQSQRDQQYLDMLTADLSRLSASAAVTAYNRAAASFNHQLASPLTGKLAQLMGIAPCVLFE